MNSKLIGGLAVLGFILAGCSSLSQVDSAGATDNPVFPDADKVSFVTGSWPNIENLRNVQSGVTRDQLYDLLGRPHFSEGFKVREWDYLFHFNTSTGPLTCQYKVLFDDNLIARNFYWKSNECAALLNPQTPQAKVAPFSLSGDVGFAFASATLTAAGLSEIRGLANQLNQVPAIDDIMVSGHTDRIGSQDYNQRLSQQRAESVRRALINDGVPAAKIQARGYGESSPLVYCEQTNRADLIACLAPNRRVDIEVSGQN